MSLPGVHLEPWVLSVSLRHGSAGTGLSQLGSLGWGVIPPLSISPHPAAVHPGEGSSSLPAASAPLGLCLVFSPPAPSFWLGQDLSTGFNASCSPLPLGQEGLGLHRGPGQSHHFGHDTSPARSEASLHVGGRVLVTPPHPPPSPGKGRGRERRHREARGCARSVGEHAPVPSPAPPDPRELTRIHPTGAAKANLGAARDVLTSPSRGRNPGTASSLGLREHQSHRTQSPAACCCPACLRARFPDGKIPPRTHPAAMQRSSRAARAPSPPP